MNFWILITSLDSPSKKKEIENWDRMTDRFLDQSILRLIWNHNFNCTRRIHHHACIFSIECECPIWIFVTVCGQLTSKVISRNKGWRTLVIQYCERVFATRDSTSCWHKNKSIEKSMRWLNFEENRFSNHFCILIRWQSFSMFIWESWLNSAKSGEKQVKI